MDQMTMADILTVAKRKKTMTKDVTPLSLQAVSEDHAYYVATDEESPFWRQVEIDIATFEELGRPTVITVTIEPGDKLNPTVTESEFDKGMRGIQ